MILLEAYWNAHPEKHALMRALAAAGRLVSAPGMYVMPDLNLIDGESLCRQVKLGRRWLREHLGIVPDACWIADCWGHHAQLPQILTRCGYRVPDDFAVAGFGGFAFSAMTEPEITTVKVDSFELGRLAVELLIKCINGEAPALKRELLPIGILKRNSL